MLGLVIATQLGWHDIPSIVLAIVLAFLFGYSLTLRPLLASGVAFGRAARLGFAVNRWLIERGQGHAVIHGHH